MKKLVIALIVVLCVVVIGLFWGVNYLYNYAIVPGEKEFLAETHEGEPDNVYANWDFIEESPLYYEMTSRDGLELFGVHLKHKQPSEKLAIVVHGYGNSSKGMEDYARLFFNQGYDVFMPDARGHGQSQGDYVGFGWDERLDIVDWSNNLVDKYNGKIDIALFGLSMGAATVMMASGEALPEQVKVIIEDCGYDKVSNELAFQLKDMFNLPSFPMIPLASAYTDFKAGYNFYEADALKQLSKNKRPMLFIHGTTDTFVPTRMIDSVYEATNGPKEKWLVEGAEHAKSIEVDPEGYNKKVAAFLAKYM
ncbi:alpha/beta hydrolase [Vagococcus xieshaowenii]|uniref:Alpha/beta hydrolase n=1 Tax=Vagococcus xieshaowenii TaxID=2562451 RepID=A0AAJ5JLU0_9ENTE|nr:alpha/beta hydrolase [Vagococcus xieshaowenii]QCA29053.1 alpha/beta hydrolase [Vagococcus xieshaowenii]TFZ40971.1 alpha/beta hydrolase [Vagococcus xieshaowenii]